MEKEEEIRKTLDDLFEKAKTTKDINEIQFAIDDYIEQGYNLRDYIHRCNLIVQKLKSGK